MGVRQNQKTYISSEKKAHGLYFDQMKMILIEPVIVITCNLFDNNHISTTSKDKKYKRLVIL